MQVEQNIATYYFSKLISGGTQHVTYTNHGEIFPQDIIKKLNQLGKQDLEKIETPTNKPYK